MEKMNLEKHLHKRMVWTSKECRLHTYIKDGVEHVKPILMMIFNEKEVCPLCTTQGWTRELEISIGQQYRTVQSNQRPNVLVTKSIIADKTLLNSTFDNFIAENDEEIQNKTLCLKILDYLKDGLVFNVILQGSQGTGKSHLAYSLLRALNSNNECRCLFVSVDEMIRLIRHSFNDNESKFNEQYFIELLSSVDFLVLDDLGAETGAIDSNKKATDFVQRVLYAVMNARQDKVTITTTNLDSKTLLAMYDKKLISRLLRNPKYLLFKDTLDKRMARIPF